MSVINNYYMSSYATYSNKCAALILSQGIDDYTITGGYQVLRDWPAATYYMGQENFDKTTGRWTCPISGFYLIHCGMTAQYDTPSTLSNGAYIELRILKNYTGAVSSPTAAGNPNVVARVRHHLLKGTSPFRAGVLCPQVLYLKKNDTICIQYFTSGASSTDGTYTVPCLQIVPVSHKQID